MPNILVVGATRGLGAALASYYAAQPHTTVYATHRAKEPPSKPSGSNIEWLGEIDLMKPTCGQDLTSALPKFTPINTVYITAGFFATEDFSSSDPKQAPNWENEVITYTTSSIAPVFLVYALDQSAVLPSGSKIILVSSESGSIALRHNPDSGNFAHHASKSAMNMVGVQLAHCLKEKKVAVGIVHPSFMRTDLTKGVGFDKFWDDGGALHPHEAAEILAKWTDHEFDMSKTGQYWAPRGTRDIGDWSDVMGEEIKGPAQLPW